MTSENKAMVLRNGLHRTHTVTAERWPLQRQVEHE